VRIGSLVKTMKRLALLGSTGSIGTSTVQVVAENSQQFCFDLLVAGSNAELLAQQVRTFRPKVAGLADKTAFKSLCDQLGVSSGSTQWESTHLACGEEEIVSAVRESQAELVVAAIVGMAGLEGVMAALDSGKDVALANKESLVVAGALVVEKARQRGARLIPVDSEHSAIFQVLQGVPSSDLSSIILTASGGPFLRTPRAEFCAITPAQAVRHPRWNMGAKISVDSATLMNKALEVIEARWLFDVEPDKIEVIVHPQSIIHSMIRLIDETVLAQLSEPDMKGPIAYALNHPHGRLPRVMQRLDFARVGEFTFMPLDHEKFPSVSRALDCLRGARGAPAVFNAANEVAVSEFLAGRVRFSAIFSLVDQALDRFGQKGYNSLEELKDLCCLVTEWARQAAQSVPE
jgi:1-deoxy-D-xylulose-5-phosphate reductoisomerase